jgi:hypothetical protein
MFQGVLKTTNLGGLSVAVGSTSRVPLPLPRFSFFILSIRFIFLVPLSPETPQTPADSGAAPTPLLTCLSSPRHSPSRGADDVHACATAKECNPGEVLAPVGSRWMEPDDGGLGAGAKDACPGSCS